MQPDNFVMSFVIACCVVTIFCRHTTPVLMPVVVLILFVGLSNNITSSVAVSARKTQMQRNASTSNPELPQTKNPRHKKSAHIGTKNTARSTENAPKSPAVSNDQMPNENAAVAEEPSRMDIFQYTPQGMQAKLDERQFRRIDTRETRDGRARVLNSLYRELLDSSVKGDPALRRKGAVESDACEPLRGRTKPNLV